VENSLLSGGNNVDLQNKQLFKKKLRCLRLQLLDADTWLAVPMLDTLADMFLPSGGIARRPG